jgi:hypothetical protein
MYFDQVLIDYEKYLRREYRKDSTRRNYRRFAEEALEWISCNTGTNTIEGLSNDHIGDYKTWCLDRYKINGNVGRLHALNNFTCKFLGRTELRVSVPGTVQVNKPVMSEKEINRYINTAKDPLEYMISMLHISNIDFDNQKLYIDDSKTGG